MFLFVTNRDDNTVSFHIWNVFDKLESVVSSVSGDELERARPSVSDDESMPSVSHDELERAFHIWNGVEDTSMPSVSDDELRSDDEMQSPTPSVSHDDELHRPLKSSKLQQGLAAVASYLLAFFLHVLAYVKRWPLKLMGQHPLPENRDSSPGTPYKNDPAATPSVSDDENKGSTSCDGAAAAPHFMPSLQVLHLDIHDLNHFPNWMDNLGWEHLSSLWEINASLERERLFDPINILETKLRRAAVVHPNHPTLHMKKY
jgi:hypothetical protein